MKALILERTRQVALVDVPVPMVADDQVLVRVDAAGVCGSDRRLFDSHPGHCDWGHEVIGVIVDVGARSPEWLFGRSVVLKTTEACGECPECHRARRRRCTGWRRYAFNGFSECVAIPWHLVAELPSPAALEYVLVEPLNVAMDLVDLAAPESGQRVMVVGGGPIGLLVLHLLRKAGLEAVLFVKHAWQARRRLAEEMGAEVKQAEELARPTGDGYDVAIVSAPYEYIPQAAAWVNFGGAVVYNGFSATPSVTLDLEDLHTRRVSLLPSFPHPQGSFERAIVHVTAERCALRRLISHRVPLHQAERVFELFSGSPEETIKVVLLGPAHVDD